MDVRIFILLAIIGQPIVIGSVSISGKITEDITFLLKTFPVPQSMRAIIEIDVSYADSPLRKQGHYPRMGIYTTVDHINIKKRCTYIPFGQLANDHLHPRMTLDESDIRPPKCFEEPEGIIHCRGNITIQDFKLRNFSFSFGFNCDIISHVSSLRGVVYNISIYVSNETRCIYLPEKVRHHCSPDSMHGFIPDLVGFEDVSTILKQWDHFNMYVTIFQRLCYKQLLQLSCYVVAPKCDPVSRQVIHPCREMCHDFKTACSKIVLNKNTVNDALPFVSSGDNNIIVEATLFKYSDCDYLPSLGGDIPCYYKSVTCKSPPSVQNATMLNDSMNYNNYSALDTVDYSCNEGFQMEGKRKISCLISGQWSVPPKCTLTESSTTHPLFVILPITTDSIGYTACNNCSEI